MGTRAADGVTRRTFLSSGLTAAGLAAAAGRSTPILSAGSPANASGAFPKGFLWGAATAAHQVEGNNINSDMWVLEHMKPSMFAEPSNDACDFYHRYRDDIALAASLGLNAFRFSIEWARIEPEQGSYSIAELDHYRRVLAACHEHGLHPAVTFWHFTTPRWIATTRRLGEPGDRRPLRPLRRARGEAPGRSDRKRRHVQRAQPPDAAEVDVRQHAAEPLRAGRQRDEGRRGVRGSGALLELRHEQR